MWPVILAALDKFDAERMERLLKVLVTVTIRYQTVGRRRTGQLEITSARAARGVFDSQLNSPMKVWQNYTQIVPTDEDFRADFSRFSETKPDRARYMLEELERVHQTMDSGASQPEVGPQSESLTLEHIFPTNPSDEWAHELQADPDIRTGVVSRLGNLCLLGGNLNREARSHGFQKKREIYLGSEIKLTQAIALKHDNWNTEAIEERQGELADLAVAAWPLPY